MAGINKTIEYDYLKPLQSMSDVLDAIPTKLNKNQAKIYEINIAMADLRQNIEAIAKNRNALLEKADIDYSNRAAERADWNRRSGMSEEESDKDIEANIKYDESLMKSIEKLDSEYEAALKKLSTLEVKRRSYGAEPSEKNTGLLDPGQKALMQTISKSLADVAGVSPEITNSMTSLIGSIGSATFQIAAAIAAVKLITEVVKQKYEWDQMNIRLEAMNGGDSVRSKDFANELGVKNDKEFRQIYEGLIWSSRGHSADEAESAMRWSRAMGDITGLDWKYIARTKMMGDQAGDYKSLSNLLGLPYLENVTLGATGRAYGVTGNFEGQFQKIFSYADKVMDVDKVLRETYAIRAAERGWNTFTNDAAAGITTGDSWYYNKNTVGDTTALGVNKDRTSVPVSVVNSVYLADETLNTLADIREHQFVNNVNVKLSQPNVAITENYYAGQEGNAEEVVDNIMNKLVTEDTTGAYSYTGDDL